APPSAEHPLGTDRLGRDVLARALAGGRVSLTIALSATAFTMLLGGALGSLAAAVGGAVDTVLTRAFDSLLAFPGFLLVLLVVAILGGGPRRRCWRWGWPARPSTSAWRGPTRGASCAASTCWRPWRWGRRGRGRSCGTPCPTSSAACWSRAPAPPRRSCWSRRRSPTWAWASRCPRRAGATCSRSPARSSRASHGRPWAPASSWRPPRCRSSSSPTACATGSTAAPDGYHLSTPAAAGHFPGQGGAHHVGLDTRRKARQLGRDGEHRGHRGLPRRRRPGADRGRGRRARPLRAGRGVHRWRR